jgi:hypothetical protein
MPTHRRPPRENRDHRDDSPPPSRKSQRGQGEEHGRPQPSQPSRFDQRGQRPFGRQRAGRSEAFGGESQGGENYEQRYSGAEYGGDRAPPQGGAGPHAWTPWGQQSERYDDLDKLAWNKMAGEGGDRVGFQQREDEDASEFSDFGRGYQRDATQRREGWQRFAAGGPGGQERYGGDAPRRGDAPAYPRGPKGYKRSDERIREDVSDRIARTPNIDASDVEVAVSGGEVTLSGCVSCACAP